VGVNGGAAWGGAISLGTSALFGIADNATLQVTNSKLDGNTAQGGAGGPGSNGGDGLGGGIAVNTGASAALSNSVVKHNDALGGVAGAGGSDGHGVGGGVYHLGMFTFDALTVIKKNRASTSNDDIFP
jgi:hypothetical protein